jgi:transcriptional regulator with XRE-family HTH domain
VLVRLLTALANMTHRPISYLRALRRRCGLTQKELAYLIGADTGSVISRVEGLKRLTSTGATLAIALVFNTTPSELFPTTFAEMREDVHRRVTDLYEELQGNPSATTRAKLDFLEQVLERVAKRRSSDTII